MITIPTLTKLLIISIVANRSFELESRCMIRLLAAVFDECISFNCEGEKEKNAVSEADAAAEHSNNAKTATIPLIKPADAAQSDAVKFNKTSALNVSGSGSATV